MKAPRRGEVWLADLNPTRGREQRGTRPVLVVSNDEMNRGPSGLAVVVPMTSTLRMLPAHVFLRPPDGGVRASSMLLCEAVRSLARERLVVRWGRASDESLARVEEALRIVLAL